jgi:hypothetical protein
MAVSKDVTLYYIPASLWNVKEAKHITAKLDITYRDEPDKLAIGNISFYDTNKTPQDVSSAGFLTDGTLYPFIDREEMFKDNAKHELRITTHISITDLEEALKGSVILLQFCLDGTTYQGTPPREFLVNRDAFLSRAARVALGVRHAHRTVPHPKPAIKAARAGSQESRSEKMG